VAHPGSRPDSPGIPRHLRAHRLPGDSIPVHLDGVLLGIREQSIAPIWLPVCLQLGVNMLDRTCLRVGVVLQQLLQDRVAEHIQELVLSKANTLDMAQFENAEYYDTLRHAIEEAGYRPATMISQSFDLSRSFITLCSMLFLIAHLS
jgi:ATP-binding cassette subfamily B protein